MKPPSAPLASLALPVSRARQRGAAGIIIAMLLTFLMAAAVLGMLSMSGSSVMDAGNNDQQISALFLAESGLERGQATVAAASSVTNAVCTGIGVGGPFALGSGTFTLIGTSYALGSVPPNNPNTPCDNSGGTPCGKCVLTATGILGANSRTISRTLSLTTVNGASCNASTAVPDCTNATAPPATWQLTLKNTYAHNAIALFDLAFLRQGDPTGAACTSAGCSLMWNTNASNGSNSVGGMGNAVTIPSGQTYNIYQTLSINKDLAEVGALFPGSGSNGPSIVGATAPSIAGARAYWDDTSPNGNGIKTVGRSTDSSGQTNNGTKNTVTTCTPPGPNSAQACNNWCLGGDTLVFGFAAHSDSGLSDSLSSVLFNTANAQANNIALSRIAKFPNATVTGAPTDVYSEVWYAHNEDYLSNATAWSGAVVTGSIGVTYAASMNNGSNIMTTVPAGALKVGDTVACGGGSCPAFLPATITATTGGTSPYTLGTNCSNPHCNSFTGLSPGTILTVTAGPVAPNAITVGDTISGTGVTAGTTITSIVNASTYVVSLSQLVASTAINATNKTIHVTGGTIPASGIPVAGTIVAVKSGVGAFAAGISTTVAAAPAPTATLFTLSNRTSTPLTGATVCGGTCAFFDQTSGTTTFAINKSTAPGTDNWAAGFMCLTGADITPISISSSTVQPTDWYEAVR